MKFSRGRIVYSAATLLMLLLGFITLGIAAGSWGRVNEFSHIRTASPSTQALGNISYEPEHLVMGPTQALVAAGVISIVSGFVACIGIFTSNNNQSIRSVYTVIACFGCSTILATLATIIYTMSSEKEHGKYIKEYSTPGEYTFESWICKFKDEPIGSKQGTFATHCRNLTADRYLVIPLFLSALVVTGSATITAYRRFL